MPPRSTGGRTPMPALTRFAVGRPRTALALWLVAVAMLTVVGFGVDGRLAASGLHVNGSESSRARDLIGANFDDSATVPVLLRGPRVAVKTQGRVLAKRLAKLSGVVVLSPWSKAAGPSPLRPSSDRALLLLSISGTSAETDARTQDAQRIVTASTSSPVHATLTGLPILTHAGTQSSLSAVRRAEAIALPVLLLALLLVFRSPLAAMIPALFGAATIGAATGALALLAERVRIDAFSMAIASMMGLALAVDYSLLVVSRLREERASGRSRDLTHAVAAAAAPTARTVSVAGAAIVVAMAAAAALSPGTAVLSTALGVTVVSLLAAIGAVVAVPAALMLVGSHIDRFGVPATSNGGHGFSGRIAAVASRRPVIGGVAAIALALLAIPVFGLSTGVPNASSLPTGSSARADYDSVANAMGSGWAEPFELVAVARTGTVTTPARLAMLARVQNTLSHDPAVRAVLGPGTIARSAAQLRAAGRRAIAAQKGLPRRTGGKLRKLDRGVNSAATGVDALRGALADANAATRKISAGSSGVQGGVSSLRSGIQGAGSGAKRLAANLADAGAGAQGLSARVSAARSSVHGLSDGVRKLGSGLADISSSATDLQGRLTRRSAAIGAAQTAIQTQRAQAIAALASAAAALPPNTVASLRARMAIEQARRALATDTAAGLDEPLRQLATDSDYAAAIASATPTQDVQKLAASAAQLSSGTDYIAQQLRALGQSVSKLSGGSGALVSALGRLDGGANKVSSAFGAVRAGVENLAGGVRTSEQRTGQLASGLQDAQGAVRGLGTQPAADPAGKPAPGTTASFLESGYFVLAALEGRGGATPFGVNVERGGQGARIVIVPRYGVEDPRTGALYKRLRVVAAQLGLQMGARAAVGGPAAALTDFRDATAHRLPVIVIVLALVTALLLGILLRSIVIPVIGVVLNLLAVGATLGLLTLLFQGSHPLLGGPGEIDAVAVTAIFGVVFALSIDYQVFIVSRVREEWLNGADPATAVRLGLERTARVVTGAALSMLGVFAAFALADVASLRQFGVGLAIAVAIDATVVRLLLLPAALRLAGRWAWLSPSATAHEMALHTHHPAYAQSGR